MLQNGPETYRPPPIVRSGVHSVTAGLHRLTPDALTPKPLICQKIYFITKHSTGLYLQHIKKSAQSDHI